MSDAASAVGPAHHSTVSGIEHVLLPATSSVYCEGRDLPSSSASHPSSTSVLPGYSRLQAGAAHLPRKLGHQPPASTSPDFKRARFAESAVSTFDARLLRDACTVEEWSWVEVITDPAAFRSRVLAMDPAVAQHLRISPPRARFTDDQWRDLHAKRYVRRTHTAYFVCGVFAVWKSDGVHLRLIYNGVALNRLCRPPPPLRIVPYHIMLSTLLDPSITAYLAFDFQTWFVQLIVHPEVARYFATKGPRGELLVLEGVAMGWAWACTIAHTLTVAFARVVTREAGIPPDSLAAAFCIDNTIFGIRHGVCTPDHLYRAVQKVAARLNIKIKASATETGRSVDWLPYRLSLGPPAVATFKPSYVEKLTALERDAPSLSTSNPTLLNIWERSGLLIYSVYAAGLPYSRIRGELRWLAANAPLPSDQGAWSRPPVRPYPHGQHMATLARELQGYVIRPLPSPSLERTAAWYVADAAGPSDHHRSFAAYVLFLPRETILHVYPSQEDIDVAELRAQAEASKEVLACVPDASTAVGFSDSTVALSAVRRGFALWAPDQLSACLEAQRDQSLIRRVAWWNPHVTTKACLADPWTRGTSSARRVTIPSCGPQHQYALGVVCPCVESRLTQEDPTPAGDFVRILREWRSLPPQAVHSYDHWYAEPRTTHATAAE